MAFIGDGSDIRSSWLRRSSQLWRSPGLNDGETESLIWTAALFGAHWLQGVVVEANDTSTAELVSPFIIYGAATEADDTSAADLTHPHVIAAATTEANDTSTADLILGYQLTGTASEAADTSVASLTSPNMVEVGTIDASVGLTGPGSIVLGTPAPIDLDLDTIDGSSEPTGPSITLIDPTPPPFFQDVYCALYDRDGTTYISSLLQAFDLQWQDAENSPGTGRVSVASSDPDADLLLPGRHIRCYLWHEHVFTWRIDRYPQRQFTSVGEEATEIVVASGRGWLAALDDVVIYPPYGFDNPLLPSQRLYSFASSDYPPARLIYWGPAPSVVPVTTIIGARYQLVTVIQEVEDAPDTETYGIFPAPLGFPVQTANWIWGHVDTSIVGRNYFRRVFTLAETTAVTITVTADNYYTLYLNGTPLLGEDENARCWAEFKTVEILMPAGTHTLAAVVRNLDWNGGINPAGFLCAVYTVDAGGILDTVIVQTDASWVSVAYPATEPGWKAGEIILDAIAEAQARWAIPNITVDFTLNRDSDGNFWPQIPGFSMDVGASLLDMLNQLAAEGWIDFRMKPGAPVLQAFIPNRGRASSTATYTKAVNIADQSYEESEQIKNRMLVKWPGGYFYVEDVTSQATFGILETTMSVDAADLAEATRRANLALADMANTDTAILLVPTFDDDVQFITDYLPYIAYGVRDYVTAPDKDNNAVAYPVRSITVQQDDHGSPDFALELNRRMRVIAREDLELLQSIGSGIRGEVKASDPLITIRAVPDQN